MYIRKFLVLCLLSCIGFAFEQEHLSFTPPEGWSLADEIEYDSGYFQAWVCSEECEPCILIEGHPQLDPHFSLGDQIEQFFGDFDGLTVFEQSENERWIEVASESAVVRFVNTSCAFHSIAYCGEDAEEHIPLLRSAEVHPGV